jgi:hypothetical protein
MQKGEKILQEVEDLREEELKREIERARNEERRVTLETELLETQQRAEEKRQQISRRQKQ